MVRCRGCGLLRTWPAPDEAALRALYEDPGYAGSRTAADPAEWALRAEQILLALPNAPATVLDFGAGDGHLVGALRGRGVAALGVEPSPAARAVAVAEHGLELHGDLAHLPSQRFDAVTMLHSLEHVPDPVATLVALRERLEAGGAIFIEVPHAGSADMWIPRSRRAILDLPAHLHHFTPATLGAVVERAGFTVMQTRVFNALLVEAAIARRVRRRGSATPSRPSVRPALPGASGTQVDRLLRLVRSRFAGPKFQLVARGGG